MFFVNTQPALVKITVLWVYARLSCVLRPAPCYKFPTRRLDRRKRVEQDEV